MKVKRVISLNYYGVCAVGGKMICKKCGQDSEKLITGEYPCNECGQPMTHDSNGVNAVLCEVCAYWLEDPEFKGMGACGNDDVNNKLVFGHADYFLISADFGCKFFKEK